MKSTILLFCFILLLFGEVFAEDQLEKDNFVMENDNCIIIGAFTKSLQANPNVVVFEYRCASKQFPESVFVSNKYIFKGRTGESTFEIRYIPDGVMTHFDMNENREVPADMKLFFERDSIVPLKISIGDPCKAERKVYLKMIALSGNRLEYQIILPECLKKYLATHKSGGDL